MNCLIGVTALCLFIGLVSSESCTTNDNCVTTTCLSGATVICEHAADAGITTDGGLCTCSSGEACAAREDCLSPNHEELECGDDQRHCYDSECICTRFPGGGFP